MKTVRRTRRTVRSAGLVAVAAAAMFSLTACQGDGGKDNDAASVSSSTETSKDSGSKDSGSDAKNGENGSSNGTDTNGTGGNGGTQNANGGGDTQAGGSGVKRKTCTAATNTIRFQRTGGSAPVILIKATNQDSERCDLYGYPFVGYPDAQAPIAVGGGKPQAVVSLEPGESAYASLSLETGQGNNLHRETDLTVELANRKQQGTGSNASLTAPGEGLALSDTSTVSYWNTTPELAMR